jgi:hypothetical protein
MVKYSCWLCLAGLGKVGSELAEYGKGDAWQLRLKDDNGPGMGLSGESPVAIGSAVCN